MRMRDITVALDRVGTYVLMLGQVGENRATQVMIDLSGILSSYPDALGSITVKQPDGTEYPAVVTQPHGMLTWVITRADIGDKPGTGATLEERVAALEERVLEHEEALVELAGMMTGSGVA